MTTPRVIEYRHRSKNCGRLLFEAYLSPGAKVRIVCPKCGGMAIFTGGEVVNLNGTAVIHVSEPQPQPQM